MIIDTSGELLGSMKKTVIQMHSDQAQRIVGMQVIAYDPKGGGESNNNGFFQ